MVIRKEVEAAYQDIWNQFNAHVDTSGVLEIALSWAAGAFIVLLIIGLYFTVWAGIRGWRFVIGYGVFSLVFISAVFGMAHFCANFNANLNALNQIVKQIDQKDEQIKQWKSRYAEPYLESLPQQQRSIIYIKIDPEAITHSGAIATWDVSAVYTASETVTTMVLAYVDGEDVVTKTLSAATKMDLSAQDQPYVTFVKLDHPLGVRNPTAAETSSDLKATEEYPSGSYHYTVHLPKGYMFTSIQ